MAENRHGRKKIAVTEKNRCGVKPPWRKNHCGGKITVAEKNRRGDFVSDPDLKIVQNWFRMSSKGKQAVTNDGSDSKYREKVADQKF